MTDLGPRISDDSGNEEAVSVENFSLVSEPKRDVKRRELVGGRGE